MFFELRQYVIRPGQQKAWVKCMEEEIIPFQVKMGMVILGSFVGEEDESVYVWIRRFESEAERKRLYDLVYQSDYWKNEISPRVGTLIDWISESATPGIGSVGFGTNASIQRVMTRSNSSGVRAPSFPAQRERKPQTNASNSSTSRSSCFIPAAQNAFSRGLSPNGARAST